MAKVLQPQSKGAKIQVHTWLQTPLSTGDQAGSPFSGFVLIQQLCLLDKSCRIKTKTKKRHHFTGPGGSRIDSVFPGISKVLPQCPSSWVIQPTPNSTRSRVVGLAVSDGGSGRIIFNLATKNGLTFKACHPPVLPQVACGRGLGMFYKSRQGSNIERCRDQTTRCWFLSPKEPVHPVGKHRLRF